MPPTILSWPLSQEYNEAIQSPATNFADDDLRRGQAVTNAIGIPLPCSGNFADVYQVRDPDGSRWAVKCFTRAVPGRRERYQEIDKHLSRAKLPFTVDFTYLEQGIRVGGNWFPVLKMEWVEGLTLNQFVGRSADKPATLEALLQIWARMARHLRASGAAHGDLQHGNVLLVPGRDPGSLAVKLIDYDGMIVPALASTPSGEVGHPAYQHPQRLREGTYSSEADRFPLLVVATALRCLQSGGRALWDRHDNGDNLLFCQQDFETPARSALFYELLKLDDPSARFLVENLIDAARKPLEQTPLVEDLLPAGRTSPAGGDSKGAPPAAVEAAEAESGPFPAGPYTWRTGGERKPRRRVSAPLIALAGAMALVGILAGVIALVASKGARDSAKGQALTRGDTPVAVKAPSDADKPKDAEPDRKKDKKDKTDTLEEPAPQTVVPSAKIFPGLLVYWPFDEGEGNTPADVSGGVRGKGHNIEWVDGVRGKAIHTKGRGSYFDFSAHPKLSFAAGADFTFCGWVRTRQKDGTVLSNRADADGTPNIDLHLNAGVLGLGVRQQGATDYIASLKGAKVVSDGAWHHFAFTRQGADLALYADGVLQQRQENTRSGGAIPTNLRALGAELYWLKEREGLDTDYLAGDFDEFCVFGRALSAAEIRTLAGKKTPD